MSLFDRLFHRQSPDADAAPPPTLDACVFEAVLGSSRAQIFIDWVGTGYRATACEVDGQLAHPVSQNGIEQVQFLGASQSGVMTQAHEFLVAAYGPLKGDWLEVIGHVPLLAGELRTPAPADGGIDRF